MIHKRLPGGPRKGHGIRTIVWLLVIIVSTTCLLVGCQSWLQRRGVSGITATLIQGGVVILAAWACLAAIFRRQIPPREIRFGPTPPYTAEEYQAEGLGPLSDSADNRALYIDLMKRAVSNILYEDEPVFFAPGEQHWEVAQEFDLRHRVAGNDCPTQAHTMIGTQRLEHIQQCIEKILEDEVPGDLAETGSFRGGATIFMRAVLRGWAVTDRRVFVCDAFVPPQPELTPRPVLPLLQALASVPGKERKRRIFTLLESLPQKQRAFPICESPSDDWIKFVMWALRHPEVIQSGDTTSLEHVKSRFARYGLLDDQVVFVPGYFAEALPQAPIEKLSLLRLDGDTYESTHDAIIELYPKLSKHGFCIVDDYNTFNDCRRAIDEYREAHGITEEMHSVGAHAVYWRKG